MVGHVWKYGLVRRDGMQMKKNFTPLICDFGRLAHDRHFGEIFNVVQLEIHGISQDDVLP
jgi:hypothetical protein